MARPPRPLARRRGRPVCAGAWLSGFFIVATDAFVQQPVGFARDGSGRLGLDSFSARLLNPWAWAQYAHVMMGSVATAAVAMASAGAFYLLSGCHEAYGRTFVGTGVVAGSAAAVLVIFPTGDLQGQLVAQHQPATLAAMEGLFRTEAGAPIVLVGQPDVGRRRLDNPIHVPRMRSCLTHRRWTAEVHGLDAFPEDTWPDNIPLLDYAYHVMAGLGTIFAALLGAACWALWRGRLFGSKPML